MANTEVAMKRVLKKLGAVRATLSGDEQDVLDDILLQARIEVEAEAPEVQAHALKADAAITQVLQVEIDRDLEDPAYAVRVLEN